MAVTAIPLGTLNRLLTSIKVVLNPGLNVTRGYFAGRMATLAFEGQASDYIDVQTGAVPSPRPYQRLTCNAWLVKSQSLAAAWEQQRLTNTTIGDVVVTTNSPTLQPYYMSNCVLMNINEINLAGTDADFPLIIAGVLNINGALFG